MKLFTSERDMIEINLPENYTSKERIVYEDDYIIVKTTGRNYDFIATVENKTNQSIKLFSTNDDYYFEDFMINGNDWVGLEANIDGYFSLCSFYNREFGTENL